MIKENKMHWLSWEKLKEPKKQGGLGFRDAHAFNIAMLAKQNWRLIQKLDSLCAKILKAKYYRDENVLSAKPGRYVLLKVHLPSMWILVY